MPRFNPLSHPICLTYPQWIAPSAWIEHVPFAMYVADLLRPRVFVELGTHYGVSYCAFCQAITELHVPTRAYAIDTWQGDPHNGFYGSDVLDALSTHHQPLYGSFSRLMQRSFDDAVYSFDDGSIDLLHIDGYHTYDAVTHDFETWLPKLSDRAVVLFHDTHVRGGSFGVWKLWEELAQRYPHFGFAHGQGLGVLAVGTAYPQALHELLDADADATALIQHVFHYLGLRLQAHQQLEGQRRELADQLQQHKQADQDTPTLNQLVQETSEDAIGQWHWLSEYDAYIDALLGEMGRKDVDRLTLHTWAEAWNERIRTSNQQLASFQRWLADAQWQLTEQSLRRVPRAHIGTDPVALCCYFDRVARLFTVGEAHFGLRPVARRHMQAETLTLWCYGVEVRLVDGAGLWLCQRLRETLPPEFVTRSEPSEVSVSYVVTAVVPPGLTEASEFLISCDDLAVFATAVDENVYWWLRRDIERTVARRSPQRLFVHAGVVGWRGVAIVIPGHGSIGKSTLVAELVRRGAVYYSDTFAVLDDQGNVHPYRGLIGLGIQGHPSDLRLIREDEPTEPLPIGLIVDGAYTPAVVWRPTVVRGTHAALSLVDSAILPHEQATQMQQIAARIATGAVALRGPRSEAGDVATLLLDMVDDALVSHALDAAGDNRGRLTDELARVAEIRLRSPGGRAERPPRRLVASRYVRKLNALPPDDHRRLLQYMLSNQHEVWESRVVDPDGRGELHDEIWGMFDRRLRGMLRFVQKQLEVPWFSANHVAVKLAEVFAQVPDGDLVIV